MFKKSIPAILGALLLGANAEANIRCPMKVNTSFMKKGGYIIEGQVYFKLTPDTQTNQLLNFAYKSTVVSLGHGQERVSCYYMNAAGNQYTLSFETNLRCSVGRGVTQCEGIHAGCDEIAC